MVSLLQTTGDTKLGVLASTALALSNIFALRGGKPNLEEHIDLILNRVPQTALDALRARHGNSRWKKYLDLRHQIRRNILVCHRIGLVDAPRQKVLDIACGGGIFIYCARYFGHDSIGIDVENALLVEIAKVLNVDRRIERVVPFKPLAISGSFDLIACMNPTFDRYNSGKRHWRWGVQEWRFFIADLADRLAPAGRIFLRINRGDQARCEGTYYYDARVHQALLPGHLWRNEYLLDHNKLSDAIARLNKIELADR